MNQIDHRALLRESLKNLDDIEKWLQRSYQICRAIGIQTQYTPEEFDAFETLTSRFSRATDFIVNQVFRTIDQVELASPSGTLLDVTNRAYKKGLIDSVQTIRTIKDLRNSIAHEYASAELIAIFRAVLTSTPTLFEIANNIRQYCKIFD